jgi:two-component system OmpR family sensor kinase
VRAIRQRLNALPLRVRLTLAYTVAMAVVLALVGGFLYLHTRSGINRSIDDALALRAHDLAALARAGDPAQALLTAGPPPGQIGDRAQLLDADGRIVAATATARRPLLSPSELAAARRGRIVHQRGDTVRILAEPVGAAGRVVVVAGDRAGPEHTLDVLVGALLIGGPLALALAALAGYALASGALRPVETMRARAATISDAEPDARLPLPEAHDEIRRLGETLNAMLDRLADARRRERAFVADASHELRTPLTILRGELELAVAGEPSPEELRRVVESATEETDRLVELAQQLLALARLDDEVLPVDAHPVAVRDLLDGVAAAFAPRAAELERALVVVGSDEVIVRADPTRLRQALDNLVDNALRYGGGTVRLDARAENGQVELHVRDEGAGFPPAFLDRAFDRFARSGRGPGSGLGLAIVAAIAAAHGGSAHAANAPEGGADVWLVLSSPFHEGPPASARS